jgi:hypothetical protein
VDRLSRATKRDRLAELEKKVEILEKALSEIYEMVNSKSAPEFKNTFEFSEVKNEDGVRLISDPWTGGYIVVDRNGGRHPYSKRDRAEQVFEYFKKEKRVVPAEEASSST